MEESCEFSPNETVARFSQYSKAYFPMEITLSGIAMLVRLLHPEKAEFPIEVTPSGIVMLVRLEHFLKA